MPVDPGGAPAAASARREGSPYPKAALLPRVVARASDLTIAFLLSGISSREAGGVAGEAGVLAGLLYLLIADALFHGQSLGKRIAGVKVVHVPTQYPADLRHSIIRNVPFGVAFLFVAVSLWGWVLFVLIGLPLLLFETYLVYTDALGIRLGDVFADTQVIDAKVVAGAALALHAPQPH